MRILIDCDGVLRNFVGSVKRVIIRELPEYKDELHRLPGNWDFRSWLTFWTEEESEDFIFGKHYYDIFAHAEPFPEATEDWPTLKEWASKNNNELVLVSAQRDQTVIPTTFWLADNSFDFKEIHYTKEKWKVGGDVLIDDSPAKLNQFKKKSVSSGDAICFKRNWNTELHNTFWSINRLNDIIDLVENKL